MTSVFFGVTTKAFHYSYTIGRMTFFGEGFRHPMDIAMRKDGVLYVPSRSTQLRLTGLRVTLFTMDEEYITQFGEYGQGDGQLMGPVSIDLDGDENVYVSDQWLNRITVFDKEGNFLSSWGEEGASEGQLHQPFGIAFDNDYNLYVVDSHNNRVQKFTKDGRFLQKWGEAGDAPGQFNLPWGITIDHNGDVYVADWRNDRIQKFTADGEYLAQFGSSGHGVGQFYRPSGVAVDKDGDIYVADWGNNRVQVFTADGRHITTITGDATLSKWAQMTVDANPDNARQRSLVRDFESERQFWNPVAIHICPEGKVLIADCMQHRIQVYQKENH